jgi:nicotinamidase/pyrazinamidase
MKRRDGVAPARLGGSAEGSRIVLHLQPEEHPMADRTALLVVDVQPDFLPGGHLAVGEGDRILPGVRTLMESEAFPVKVATQDWHPPEHASFASNHPDTEPFQTIQLHGHEQVLWPDHCVQGSPGARLHPDMPWKEVHAVIRKGTDPQVDSYSGFRNNWGPSGDRPATGLAGYLREREVEAVVVCGLARDYCVRWTAEDAAEAGFQTTLVWDLTRSVDPSGDDALRRELESRGIHITTLQELEI